MLQIMDVLLMPVSLTLETDGTICLHPIALTQQVIAEFQHIDHEESHKQPLTLLTEVDKFVVDISTPDVCISTKDDDAAEGDSCKGTRRKFLRSKHYWKLHERTFFYC